MNQVNYNHLRLDNFASLLDDSDGSFKRTRWMAFQAGKENITPNSQFEGPLNASSVSNVQETFSVGISTVTPLSNLSNVFNSCSGNRKVHTLARKNQISKENCKTPSSENVSSNGSLRFRARSTYISNVSKTFPIGPLDASCVSNVQEPFSVLVQLLLSPTSASVKY